MAGRRVKIGVLNDRSGIYADLSGEGSVVAARMAVEDFGAAEKGINVEIVSADHQNKPDIASNIARQWFDEEGVDVIVDVPTSSAALAVNEIAREKNKIFLISGAATVGPDRRNCSPNTVHWTYDTWALANGTGRAMVEQGGETWFFLTADYAFGHALERDTTAVVEAAGGEVVGTVRHPFPGQDFSSFLLQAQSSGAKVIGLANAGGDTINSIKQAAEFGITQGGQSLAGPPDLHHRRACARARDGAGPGPDRELLLGPERRDPRLVRSASPRRMNGDKPTMVHAGVYAAVLHYLKAVEATGGKDADGGDGEDEGNADRRPAVRRGRDPRRRPQDPRHVPVPGQGARRVEGPVGLLRAARHHPGRGGLPPARGGRLPAGAVGSRASDGTGSPARPIRPQGAGAHVELLGIPPQALFGQLLLGLINGSFYAMLSLGLAVIFGLLNIINFAHGAQYMMGAFVAWMLLNYLGIGYWSALILAPLIVGAIGIVIERLLISRLYQLDHLYGLLLTFGLALIIQGLFRNQYGVSGLPYQHPAAAGGRAATSASCSCRTTAAGWSSPRSSSASAPGS